ncbi:MAG: RNA polymerase sigma factor [Burkholderiales bacterium]|nr:RNA polymerase sigma factor [Burkholderiales bacterium]
MAADDESPGDEDAALMLAYARGDARAFDALYARHGGGSYRYFLRSLRNEALAGELFQDLWLQVVRARASYTVQARFATWLYRMAHNRLIDHYRRSGVVELVALDADGDTAASEPADPQPGPEDAAAGRESARRMLQLVEALPAAQREAFLLQEEGGLSLAEIAAATGAGTETVKSRLRYAMTRLRAGMKDFL